MFCKNTFWHERLNREVTKRNLDSIPNVFVANVQPFWNVNQLNNGKSACRQYPTTNYDFNGQKCSNTQAFASQNPENIVNQMMEIVENKRENLLVTYFDNVDIAGHNHGTKSIELNQSLELIDGQMRRLYDGLKEKFNNKFDLIILSDHGMLNNQCIDIEDSFVSNKFNAISDGPVFTAYKIAAQPESVITELKNHMVSKVNSADFTVYLKNEIPERLNYKGLNAPDILILAKKGFYIKLASVRCKIADHGYPVDDENPDMLGIFIVVGKSFGKISIEEAETVDVYNAICKLMKFQTCPTNDGSKVIADALFYDHLLWMKITIPIIIVVAIIVVIFLVKTNRHRFK